MLACLQLWAEKRPVRRTARSQQAIRREHNQARIRARWRQKPCCICTELASQQHHIVQIQHGGTNRPDNKVWVCTSCHRKIHPQMALPPTHGPIGTVPYMTGTERPDTCPACGRQVISVQPIIRRTRYPMAQSRRRIYLESTAQAPYTTIDLHQSQCFNKRGFSNLQWSDLGQLAKRDVRWAEQRAAGDYGG